MAADTREEILKKYVGDMVGVIKHITEACQRQADDPMLQANPEGHQVVTRTVGTLRSHLTRLEQHAQNLGATSSVVKETITTVTGAAVGLYDKVRSEGASKMLRDDYVALTMAAMAYEMLHTTGLALKDTATAELAIAHLRDLPPLIMEIGHVTPKVIIRELAEKGIVADQAVADQAAANTEEAWRRQPKAA